MARTEHVYTEQELNALKKNDLIKIVLNQQQIQIQLDALNQKIDNLEARLIESQSLTILKDNTSNLLVNRIKILEMDLLKSEQYSRRECLDISGMDKDVKDDELEGKVCELLKSLSVEIKSENDIQACHRYGRHKNVIVKFSNRKTIGKILANKS